MYFSLYDCLCVLSAVSSLAAMVSRLEMIAKQKGFDLFLYGHIALRLQHFYALTSDNLQGKCCSDILFSNI